MTSVSLLGRRNHSTSDVMAVQLLDRGDRYHELNLVLIDPSVSRLNFLFAKDQAYARQAGVSLANMLQVPLVEHSAVIE